VSETSSTAVWSDSISLCITTDCIEVATLMSVLEEEKRMVHFRRKNDNDKFFSETHTSKGVFAVASCSCCNTTTTTVPTKSKIQPQHNRPYMFKKSNIRISYCVFDYLCETNRDMFVDTKVGNGICEVRSGDGLELMAICMFWYT
jgi:hypothetical protein